MKNVIFVFLIISMSIYAQSVDFMNYTYPYEWLRFSSNPIAYKFVSGSCETDRESQYWVISTLVKFEKTNYSGKKNEYALYFNCNQGTDSDFPTILLVSIKNSKLEFIDSFKDGWNTYYIMTVEFATDKIIIKRGEFPKNPCPSGNCMDEVTTTFKFKNGKFKQVNKKVRQVKQF